jgi:predicted transcriptional regulator
MKNFTRIPNELLKLSEKGEIDCYDIAVYFAIFMHKNSITKKCYPSTRRLAKILKVSDKTVRTRIANLEKCGMLNRTYKKGAVTHYTTAVSDGTNCGISYLYNKTKNKTNNNEKKLSKKQVEKNRKAIEETRKNLYKQFNLKTTF